MSLFITFEGTEGSGKSYQATRLYEKLTGLSIPTVLTCEPGGTPLGATLEDWLKWRDDVHITPLAELMLFNAARAQVVNDVIRPNLEQGRVVISDRYADSTTVYQGYGRGLDIALVESVNHTATGDLVPDVTILLDLPADAGMKRRPNCQPDRFEKESLAYHQRVRDGYLGLAAREPARWLVIDGARNRDEIAEAIWEHLCPRLSGADCR